MFVKIGVYDWKKSFKKLFNLAVQKFQLMKVQNLQNTFTNVLIHYYVY